MHPPQGYYETNAYPTRSVLEAGGILVGGSDAPIAGRDPMPFVNMARAVSRALPGQPALNPAQRVTLIDALDSYTINGARFLGWGDEAGSLEVGKSADFIILDRDIFAAAARGDYASIEGTRVRETWFRGSRVYARFEDRAASSH
jgi:predicted amidohydrolase YtcJ